jgi:hypothetical protein
MKDYILRWEEAGLSSAQVRAAWLMCDYVDTQRRVVDDAGIGIVGGDAHTQRSSGAVVRGLNQDAAMRMYDRFDLLSRRVTGCADLPAPGRPFGGRFELFLRSLPVRTAGLVPPDDQVEVLRYLHARFSTNPGGGPVDNFVRLLVTGGPGTGKSYLAFLIDYMCDICGFGVMVKTAYAGVAASHVGGQTLCSLFQIPFAEKLDEVNSRIPRQDQIRPLEPANLQVLRDMLHVDHICCLLIDEVSMITPYVIRVVDLRLRQATGRNIPFGGVCLLFVSCYVMDVCCIRALCKRF